MAARNVTLDYFGPAGFMTSGVPTPRSSEDYFGINGTATIIAGTAHTESCTTTILVVVLSQDLATANEASITSSTVFTTTETSVQRRTEATRKQPLDLFGISAFMNNYPAALAFDDYFGISGWLKDTYQVFSNSSTATILITTNVTDAVLATAINNAVTLLINSSILDSKLYTDAGLQVVINIDTSATDVVTTDEAGLYSNIVLTATATASGRKAMSAITVSLLDQQTITTSILSTLTTLIVSVLDEDDMTLPI